MRTSGILFLMSIVIITSGCSTIHYDATTLKAIAAMNKGAGAGSADYEVVGQFKHKKKVIFLISDLITIKDAELDLAIEKAIVSSGGDGIINISIHEKDSFIDLVIASLTYGLLSTRSVEFRGDIVKFKGVSTSRLTVDEQLEIAVEQFRQNNP